MEARVFKIILMYLYNNKHYNKYTMNSNKWLLSK